MFVVLLTYKKPLELIDLHLKSHREFLDKAYKDNLLVVSGPQIPRTGGVIVSHLKDKTILENLIKQDPFYLHDLAEYQILEFDPVKFHPKFNYFLAS